VNAPAARRRKLLTAILRVLLVLAFAVLILRYTRLAERLFYFPTREPFDTPPGVRDVSFTSSDGVTLHGWLMLPRGASPGARVPAVLHVHGNAGNVSSHAAFSEFLPDAGVAVLLFDYRSYGRSDPAPGRLTREALLNDTRAAWQSLKSQPEIDPDRLGIYGVSIGGVFGSALAAETPDARCLCLVAPFTSWSRIAHQHMPIIGPALVMPGMDPVHTVTKLGERPLLVIHGGDDTIIPPTHGGAVVGAATKAGVDAELQIIRGVGHNDLVADEVQGRTRVAEFFTRRLAR